MPPAKRKMSNAHKQALAEGRRLGQAVREYVDALEEYKPKRGRRRTPDSIRKRLDAIRTKLADARGLERVQLLQERMDLDKELNRLEHKRDISAAETKFVKSAKEYSKRKGISYAAWREAGVSADVLRRAGINRGFDPDGS